jgi:hypothetical protein
MRSLVAVLALVAAPSSFAFDASRPNLSGYWELRFDSRNIPPASLLPQAAQEDRSAADHRHAFAIRWCHHLGMPFLMGDRDSAPIDILQSSRETAIVAQPVSAARHIYTDGRGHPNSDKYDATTNGHSVGHWEGDTLVVDTIGFNDLGVTSIPGGGKRTAASHLVERFRLLDGAKRLSVVFTWEDPGVFSKPHTYEYRYYRAAKGTTARELFCDASDEERGRFLLGQPELRPAPSNATTGGPSPDLSGFWELRYDSRNVPRAVLGPKVTPAEIAAHARGDQQAIRWCNYLGTPFLMGDSAPIDIRQGRIEVAIAGPASSVARHIYTDGRKHVNPDVFDNTTNGDSIGHWEGDTLVVDTVGFAVERGVTSIPGGGFKTADSHLSERFRLLDGGKKLSVTFTWTDSNVFTKPHTYQYIYYRAPANTNVENLACDAFDEQRAKFLEAPPGTIGLK